ncbi:hypothetical protein FHQ18_00245 [Deferribacter autotrophicus]|uniref:PilY1 beta-propeller domain-containing protein n=1 Tax=Deferribacter autotrophicus TaxID=500465 RepID=A0A5A8F917_9BACT|nr:PilC/PilY family type IV pilus protein [Deferribacter autotrophicus]KAA0259342.1 hypothetical protein FHQ18_00245 [Deferribacter autotrophicus]
MKSIYKILLFQISILFLFSLNVYSQNSCQDYTYIPPTFSAVVPPTVMIALDVSGSMSWDAYLDPNYDSSVVYEGFFDPEKNYKKINGVWSETTLSASSCPSPDAFYLDSSGNRIIKACWNSWWWPDTNEDCLDTSKVYSGNCLNYWILARIDVFRWAMTGGVPDSCPNGATGNTQKCDPEIACSGDSCIIKTHWNVKIESLVYDNVNHHGIMDAVLYKLKEKDLRPRIGIMFFAGDGITSNGRSVYVGDFLTANSTDDIYPYKNLITSINTVDVGGATPSGPAMWDVWNYYLQNDPQYGGLDPDDGSIESNHFKDPLWICTNGEGTGLQCNFAPCSSNYVILASDGQWNTPSNDIAELDSNGNSPDPVVPAREMHIGAVRSKDNVFVKIDAVYTLGMFLGGTGEQSLKNVAMYGTFDKNVSGMDWPGGTTLDDLNVFGADSRYPDDSCNMDDAGDGRGSGCEPLPASQPDWDQDGNGLPDTFYSAKDARELKEKLEAIFSDILRRASSGTSIATVSTENRESSMLFQAYYYPALYDNNSGNEISWIGDVRTYFLDDKENIREDTNTDDKLSLTDDKILIFKFLDIYAKTMGFKIDDADADLIPDKCEITDTDKPYELIDLNPIWSASEYLKNLSTDNRDIFLMYNNTKTLFNPTDTNVVDYLASIWNMTTTDTVKLMKFIRGYDFPADTTYRSRHFINSTSSEIYGNVYKLGDIISSTPRVLKDSRVNQYDIIYRDQTYYSFINSETVRNRANVVFVGANDGMVHAFFSGKIQSSNDLNYEAEVNNVVENNTITLGKELWAFIPTNVLPYLKWYYEEGKDCHVPKVDYRFMLVDASIGDDVNKSDSWRTLLIGMMGFGGKPIDIDNDGNYDYSSSVFAIDVTDPLNPKVLWEYKLPDYSLTLSFPGVIRKGEPASKGEWYLIFGSGPLNPEGSNFVSSANIFILDLKTGVLVKQISVDTKVAIGDVETLDVDHDYQVDMVVFGSYGGASSQIGKLYFLNLRDSTGYKDIASLKVADLQAVFDVQRPIFSKVANTIDDDGKLWLYFVTGRFLNTDDKVDNLSQYIVGIKDSDGVWKTSSNFKLSFNDLYDSTDAVVEANISKVECFCLGVKCGDARLDLTSLTYTCDKGYPIVTETTGDLLITETLNGVTPSVEAFANALTTPVSSDGLGYSGWYYRLGDRERGFTQPFIAGSIVDVLTFTPNNDLCSYGGTTNLHAMYYKSGTPGPQPMFLQENQNISITTDTQGNIEQKITFIKSLDLGVGAPPIGEGITATPMEEKGEYVKLIQTSVGTIIKQKQKGEDVSSKLLFRIMR